MLQGVYGGPTPRYGQIATIQIPKTVSIWLSIVSQFHHVVSSSLYVVYHHDMMQRLRLIMVDYAFHIFPQENITI